MNWETVRVWKEETISNQFVKYLKEEETLQLFRKKHTLLGVISERGIIQWVDKSETKDFWEDKIQHHICEEVIKDDDDYFVKCEYEDFTSRYFFVASLWKTIDDKDLIILEHYH